MLAACLVSCERQRQEKPRLSAAASISSATVSQVRPVVGPSNAASGVTAQTTQVSEQSVLAAAQSNPASEGNTAAQDEPLVLGPNTFYFKSEQHPCPEGGMDNHTVDSWELRDAVGRVIHREAYPPNPNCETSIEVSASTINTRQGHGILLTGGEEPSAPGTGWWVQVYGIYQGQLVAFSKPIGGEGEFMGMFTEPRSATVPPRPNVVDLSGGTANTDIDLLKFKLWTGNFYIIYPLQIDWNSGTLRPAWRCSRSTSAGMVDQCSYFVEANAGRRTEAAFVRLFPEAEDSATPTHIVLNPESKIEFLEVDTPVAWSPESGISVEPSPNLWLKIRVNGHEGWIHTQEDFVAVGLPFAG